MDNHDEYDYSYLNIYYYDTIHHDLQIEELDELFYGRNNGNRYNENPNINILNGYNDSLIWNCDCIISTKLGVWTVCNSCCGARFRSGHGCRDSTFIGNGNRTGDECYSRCCIRIEN